MSNSPLFPSNGGGPPRRGPQIGIAQGCGVVFVMLMMFAFMAMFMDAGADMDAFLASIPPSFWVGGVLLALVLIIAFGGGTS